LPLLS